MNDELGSVLGQETIDLDQMRVEDEDSASLALARVMVSVSVVNRSLATAPDEALGSFDILKKLTEWIHKLTAKLREITKGIGASSSSISVSGPVPPRVSVAVNFAAAE